MTNNVSLRLNDLLNINGINPKDVMLIRHSKSHDNFKKCFDSNFIIEYTSVQKPKFAKDYKYWMIFISDAGTTAKYYGLFKVDDIMEIDKSLMPKGFPCPEMYEEKDNSSYYKLSEVCLLTDMKDRLVIDWGKATISWFQRADKQNKNVLSISIHKLNEFVSYEDTVLSFDKLKEIIENPLVHEDYIMALGKAKGVYLISDTKTGKQYVGAAYGEDCLLGRWTGYVNTKHNGNKLLKQYLDENPDGYKTFQFSILRYFSPRATNDEILNSEKLYKKKLLSKKFGWNDN